MPPTTTPVTNREPAAEQSHSKESQQRIAELKRIYGLNLDAEASHQLAEQTV